MKTYMRLYKMELYKICSKKLFLLSAFSVLVIFLLYFNSFVIGTKTTINGKQYTGYQAIVADRKIIEEFKGALTDDKIEKIVQKYGFPSGVSADNNTFLDKNYLNDFVMKHFSDGYFHNSHDYKIATSTYKIAESDLGLAGMAIGKAPVMEYAYGWNVFTNVLGFGCILGMFLILFAVSPIFSEENYVNIRQILFTTKEGSEKDVTAKIAAVMTVTVITYVIIIGLDLLLVGCTFGFDGRDCFYAQVMDTFIREWNNYDNMSTWLMKDFIRTFILGAFIGTVEEAAIALYCSAHCRSPFQSVIMSAISLFLPFFLCVFGRDNYNGILFIVGQLFGVFLIGLAIASLFPNNSGKAYSVAVKILCPLAAVGAGLVFRKKFPFFYTAPISLITEACYSDLDIFNVILGSWVRECIFLFAIAAFIIFIICSRKKYEKNN